VGAGVTGEEEEVGVGNGSKEELDVDIVFKAIRRLKSSDPLFTF
jgi:hypothetical protein